MCVVFLLVPGSCSSTHLLGCCRATTLGIRTIDGGQFRKMELMSFRTKRWKMFDLLEILIFYDFVSIQPRSCNFFRCYCFNHSFLLSLITLSALVFNIEDVNFLNQVELNDNYYLVESRQLLVEKYPCYRKEIIQYGQRLLQIIKDCNNKNMR